MKDLPQALADARAAGWAEWIKSEADENAVMNGAYFDPAAGQHVVKFFSKFLKHSKGQFSGKPFTLLEWQENHFIMPLFGWKREDGTRRYRTAYIEVPKKNGKSAIASGLEIYMLCGDAEPGAEVYVAATARDQAAIIYKECAAMVESSPQLLKRLSVFRGTKTITYNDTAWLRALSSEAKIQEGINAHFLVFDELHAQPDRVLWDTLAYSGAMRRQPLLLSITTAGVYSKSSICWEQHDYAKRIIEGKFFDDSFFGLTYSASLDDDWTSEETWKKANPSYGVIINPDKMREDAIAAQNSPAKENAFRRYRLNQWLNQSTRWLQMEAWNVCDAPIDERELVGEDCYGGLDLAQTTDIAAFVLVFPRDNGCFDVLPYFWIPEDNMLERSRHDRVNYDLWSRDGFIQATPGNVIDYSFIKEKIKELNDTYNIQQVGFDRWNATQLGQELEGEGIEMIPISQGMAGMSSPMKELMRLVLSKNIRHGGNPVLEWMASNLVVDIDANGNLRPNKEKSPEKIDGMVALVMALGRAILQPPPEKSVYTERDIIVF